MAPLGQRRARGQRGQGQGPRRATGSGSDSGAASPRRCRRSTGSFPEPFLHGSGGKRIPDARRVHRRPSSAACNATAKRLTALGVVAARGGINARDERRDDPCPRRHRGGAARGARRGGRARRPRPAASGICGPLQRRRQDARRARRPGRARRTRSAPGPGSWRPRRSTTATAVWFVTGTDDAGVEAAARRARRGHADDRLRARRARRPRRRGPRPLSRVPSRAACGSAFRRRGRRGAARRARARGDASAVARDLEVVVESGAGEGAMLPDAAFADAGAHDRRPVGRRRGGEGLAADRRGDRPAAARRRCSSASSRRARAPETLEALARRGRDGVRDGVDPAHLARAVDGRAVEPVQRLRLQGGARRGAEIGRASTRCS